MRQAHRSRPECPGGTTQRGVGKYGHRLAAGLERTGAARELTVEAMITQLACAGLELREGSDAARTDVRLYLEKVEELQRLQHASSG